MRGPGPDRMILGRAAIRLRSACHAGKHAGLVLAVRIDDGLITGLYAVRNPEKLSHMEQEMTLRR
jgi:hypothetical protein